MTRPFLPALVILAAAAAVPAWAQTGQTQTGQTQTGQAPLTAQQERMKSCNAEAGTKSLAGNERQSFMRDCLAGRTAAAPAQAPLTAQQQRMKSCNAEAATRKLSSDTRQRFMSSCLSGNTATGKN